jgi:4-hydroxy-tetrahydrodipicolinate reductase
MKTVIGINGACGRMGLRVVQLAQEDNELQIGAALDAPQHPNQGRDIGEIAGLAPLDVSVTAELPLSTRLDVMLDFSTPEGTLAIVPVCAARRIPLVVGTTGHSSEQREQIQAAAHETAVLVAPNMSLAINTLFELVRQTAKILHDHDFDVEISAYRDDVKQDALTGTGFHCAKIVQEFMGHSRIQHGREALLDEHSARPGDHTILFRAPEERLELVHRAHSRDCYVRGALTAAKYLADRPAGKYSMDDVLGAP